MPKALKMLIEGRVQGVGFRRFIFRNARMLNISGYVKNNPDGKVEVLAIGENDAMADFIKSAKKGPGFAWVYNITYQEIELENNYDSFEIKF
jgi:acylphosphatase